MSVGMQTLEIGCGTGLFTELFMETGAQIAAVDISTELIEKAKARDLPTTQVTFSVGRFEDCGIDGPFDAVVGSSVLHHLELASGLNAILRVLKPGGLMSFAEPNLLNPQVFLERRFRKWFPNVSPDETAFVRWGLQRTLVAAGFENVEITPFDWLHPSTPRAIMGIVKAVGGAMERVPMLREFSGSLWIRAQRPFH